MRSFAILIAVTATAAADPPCLGTTSVRITGTGGKLVICAGEPTTCRLIADAKAALASADWPGYYISTSGTYGRIYDQNAVCAGGHCRRMGAKLAAAAFRVQAEITSDVEVVVFDSSTAWNVAADAPMTLVKPPKAETNTPVIHVAGASLVTEWRNCADAINCDGIAQLVDKAGTNVGPTFPGGDVIVLDAHHAAVLGYGRMVTTFDSDTHKQIGQAAVMRRGALQALAVGRIDDTTIGAAWLEPNSMTWKLAAIKAPVNKAPSIAWARYVPVCGP